MPATRFALELVILAILIVAEIVTLFIIINGLYTRFRTRVPFVSTSRDDIRFLAKKLALTDKDRFLDLGSGTGKVVFLLERFSGASGAGYELGLWTHLWALVRKRFGRYQSEFHRQSFFGADWGRYQVVYGYLFPFLLERVEQKFLAECKPGTKIVMRDFPLPNLAPVEVYKPNRSTLYIYQK